MAREAPQGSHPGEPLFPNARAHNVERRWKPDAEWQCWARACKAAAVEHVRPNWGGRHAFITHELKDGTNPVAVQHFAGHARLQTTQVYLDEFSAVDLAELVRPNEGQNGDKPKKPARK